MSSSSAEAIRKLRVWLGPAKSTPDPKVLGSQLAAFWDTLEGSSAEGMSGYKLINRIEKPVWDPPILEFDLARHGGTVLGSTREELHRWRVDLDNQTAEVAVGGFRQVRPRSPALDTRQIAQEVARLVKEGVQSDPRIQWNYEVVEIVMSKIDGLKQGSAVAQTLQARRKRFRRQLNEEMAAAGYRLTSRAAAAKIRYERADAMA